MLSGIQQIIIDVLTNGITTAAIAMGFLLVLRGTGVFNVGYGALFVGAGYVFVALFAVAGLPLLLSFAATAVVMASVTALLDYGFRIAGGTPQHSAGDRSLIASVGVALIIEYTCGLFFGKDVWSVPASQVSVGYFISPAAFLTCMSLLMIITYYAIRKSPGWVTISVVVSEICLTILGFSQSGNGILPRGRLFESLISLCCLAGLAGYGRLRRGLGWHAYLSSPATARILGFNSNRYRLYCALAAGAVMGIVSASRAVNAGVRPDESWRVLVGSAFVALLAGRMSISLLVMAGIIYALASYMAVLIISSNWRDAVGFSLLFLLLSFKSQSADVETAPAEV